MLKKLLVSSTIASAILLGACTSAQVEANILSGCEALGAGAQAVATIAGLLPNGTTVSTVVSGLIGSVTADCPAFASSVANTVAAISNIGGSGQVTVEAKTAEMRRMGKKAMVSQPFYFGPYGS